MTITALPINTRVIDLDGFQAALNASAASADQSAEAASLSAIAAQQAAAIAVSADTGIPVDPPSAPALIASVQAMQMNGLELLSAMGTGTGRNNAQNVLNELFPELSAYKIPLLDSHGLELTFTGQTLMRSDLKLWTPFTKFMRSPDYVPPPGLQVQSNRAAMFVNPVDGTRLSNIEWEGGTWDVLGGADITVKGSFFTLECDDFIMRKPRFLNWQQGHVMFFRGDRGVGTGIWFKTPDLDESVESAGWRQTAGDDCTWQIDYGECSNDLLMLVCAVNSGEAAWIRRSWYVNSVTKSLRAKGAGTAGVSNNGGTVEATAIDPGTGLVYAADQFPPGLQFLGGIEDSGFFNCRSPEAGSNFYRIIADGSGRANMINRFHILGTAGNLISDNPGTDGLEIEGLAETAWVEVGSTGLGNYEPTGSGLGSVGTVILKNIACNASNTNDANVISAPGAVIDIDGMKANALRAALKVNEAKRVSLRGPLHFTGLNTTDGSGDANEKHVVKTDTAFTGDVDFHSRPLIDGIPSSKSAFKIRAGRVRLFLGAEVNKSVGATGTSFADVAAGATLEYLDEISGTVDTLAPGGSGTIRTMAAPGQIGTAASFTPVFADASTGGNVATGSISGTWVRNGDEVTVQIRGTDIVTTSMTAGNALYIRGLPVAIRNGNANNAVAPCSMENVTYAGNPEFWGENGTTYGRILQTISGAPRTALTVAGLTSGTADIFITLTYLVD